MAQNILTIGDFLEPYDGPDADELHHTVASLERTDKTDGRYEELGHVEKWQGFNRSNICSSSIIRPHLETTFQRQWQAWLPPFSRIIFNERQLETFYARTLITRVNIALEMAIPLKDPRATIIVCPSSFDSHPPDDMGAKETIILPDWIVVQGSYALLDENLPDLRELSANHQILAVGDTKLARYKGEEGDGSNLETLIPGTTSCRREYLAQVQHYAKMLRTRFGFILSNDELVVVQFIGEEDATPRSLRYRGLRSSTRPEQLGGELPLDFLSFDSWSPGEDEDEGNEISLPTPSKRKYENSPQSSRTTPQRIRPKVVDPSGLPDEEISIPSSPPGPTDRSASLLSSPPVPTSSQPALKSSDHDVLPSSTSFAPTERGCDVGRALIRSFEIPNKDREDPKRQSKTHPAKALFALLMLPQALGADGRKIDIREVKF